MSTLKVGKPAPNFTLQSDADESVSLSSFKGRAVVLFFYPKDDTPGCTVEACSFRDALPRFGDLDAVVLGISPDTPRKHRNFKKKFDLPYTLLSDTDHKLAESWGLWVEKLFWGRKYWGVARTTFVIDAKGRVAKIFENVKPEEHAAEVAEAVEALA
ncbi:MAG TPA: thioredoxin-dependent thiol peroxidase [Gemmatimonadaceae bacterium]|jgi:peroxiredoxin Q/BCP